MRKVLSFVLVLAMILGSVSMAFAASPTDVVGKDSEEAVNVLMEFGVVTGYPDGSFRPAGIVTRAEMSAFIIRALGLNPTAPASTQFKDVPSTYWASKYVAYAANLGIILGRTPTMFDPNATVSYDEAVTMLVRALGYTEASLNGTYPAAYVSKAMALGILGGNMPTGTAGANRGDIAKLVFNTLPLPIGKVGTDNIWVAAADPSDNMMKRLGAEDYTPDGTTTAGLAFVVTGDEESIIPLRNYQGAYVTAYANSDNEIIAINEVKSEFITDKVTLSGGATVSAIGVNAKIGDYKVKANPYTANLFESFVNGANTPIPDVTADGNTYTFGVVISGNYITKIYSAAKWTVEEDNVIDSADLTDIADDNKLFGQDIPTDNKDMPDYTKFALYGVSTLADIQKDDVVYTYYNTVDKVISRIDVGQEVISGDVTKIKGTTYTINGTGYKFAKDEVVTVNNAITTYPKIDASVKAKLDYFGNIYDYESISAPDTYAVVLKMGTTTDAFGTVAASIKLFLADGTSKVFDVDYESVSTAGIITSSGAWDYMSTTSGGVVKYGLDKDGVIESMKLMTPGFVTVGSTDLTAKGYFNGHKVNSDALIFTYDAGGDANDADTYGIASLANLLDVTITAAQYNLDSGTIDLMLIDDSATSNANDVFAVVVDTEINSSTLGFGVDTLVDGSATFYNSKTNYTTFGVGDMEKLYKINFTAAGDVDTLTALAKSSLNAGIVHAAFDLTSTAGVTISGKVVTIATKSGIVNLEAGVTLAATNASITLDSDVVVYTWNSTDKVFEKGSISDIKSANNVEFYDVVDKDMVFDIVLCK